MNKHRGTFDLQLGEEQYTVCFSINSICALEEATGKTVVQIGEILSDAENLSVKFVRAFLWSGLIKHHPMTEEAAGELLDKYGMENVLNQLVEGFSRAFPSGGENHPQTAERNQAGNGLSSSKLT